MTKKLEISEPTAKTPALALLTLQVAQTHLIEQATADGPGSDAARALELVERAVEIMLETDFDVEH